MLRLFPTVAALMLLPSPAIGAPSSPLLQPTGKWVMNYTPTSCEAKRRFGNVAIAIIPGPLGESTRVMLELPGRADRARQFPALVDPVDGRGRAKATALLFPMKAKGSRGLYSVLPNALIDRVMSSGRIDIEAGNSGLRIAASLAKASLALGKTDALRKALDACMADLRTQWGMVGGKLPTPAIASFAQGNISGIFRSEDYPEDAMDANQDGTTSYLLMIGRDGSVMDCVVNQSSGIASLDAMGCQVIRERAKFKPATDAQGRPAVDTIVTAPIRWAISG